MKKVVQRMMDCELELCNICEEEIIKEPFNTKRIEIVRHLFKTDDFHAHEGCINKIVRETFEKYITPPLNQ